MATYDIEALKSDLPTAKELAQFVYDRTQIALQLLIKIPLAEEVDADALVSFRLTCSFCLLHLFQFVSKGNLGHL
mgnify:CR=1 FL=1